MAITVQIWMAVDSRFTYLEEHTIREGRDLHDMTLQEMDAIWDEAKEKGL